MRLSAIAILLLIHGFALAQIEVPRSESPEGHFGIMMETDKDQAGYEMDSAPTMWIEDKRQKRRLVEFLFAADPSSDDLPLRKKITVLWNAESDAVAIQFQERHYSHLSIYGTSENLVGSS